MASQRLSHGIIGKATYSCLVPFLYDTDIFPRVLSLETGHTVIKRSMFLALYIYKGLH